MSRQSEHKRAKLAAAEHQRLEVKAPSRDDIDDSSDDEDPETRAARLRRIDNAATDDTTFIHALRQGFVPEVSLQIAEPQS